ncbi:acyl-CoA dehydrogenase family protein, partial [Acinetobacter baumannii]
MVGQPHRGLPAMFTMMNHERLFVGIQGIGVGECAAQSALAYAREREQGRAPDGPRNSGRPADAIIHLPDVRR